VDGESGLADTALGVCDDNDHALTDSTIAGLLASTLSRWQDSLLSALLAVMLTCHHDGTMDSQPAIQAAGWQDDKLA
jgi:hypothetical protein